MDRPLISVIVPVYNIALYVAEALNSVTKQSIGFTDKVEVIIVDDGSTDNSADVCKEYVKRYPQNMRYIHQKNAGVSKARNKGVAQANGEYIHFFDGDDKLSRNFYKTAINFFQKHGDEVDFVAAKLNFFDAAIDSHPLNYKFKKSRVIDVTVEPDNPILHVISCVFRRTAIQGISFDERLSVSEDMKFLSNVLIKKKKYGVVTKSIYNYRKRSNSTSAVAGKEKNKSYYDATPLYAYEHMLETWKQTDSRLIEYTLLYDISYRLDQATAAILSDKERQSYKNTIKNILCTMSDEVIARHRFLSIDKKLYVFGLKYGDELADHIQQKDNAIYMGEYRLYNTRSVGVYVGFIQKVKNGYKLEGYIDGYIIGRNHCRLRVGRKVYDVDRVSRVQREAAFLGDIYNDGGAFEVIIDADPGDTISFEDARGNRHALKTGLFTRLASYRYAYRRDTGRLLDKSPYGIQVHKYSRLLHVTLELRQLLTILTHWKLDNFVERFNKMRSRNFSQLSSRAKLIEAIKPSLFVVETVCMIPRAVVLRVAYYLAKQRNHRPIWIISDRGMAAGDNGEALFRYIMERRDCPADVYFALSKKSKDYERLSKIGPVLNYGSLHYKYKFLLAEKIISSHADVEVTNPFLRQIDHFVDLYNFDFIFLQHGIIRNDLSGWLNRFDKNISLFVTSAQKEYDSILNYPYYYKKENILLSGLPRYDYLDNNPQKKIVIAPTYRNNLLRLKTNQYGERAHDDSFKNSEYYRFYNNLINNPLLLESMKSKNLIGEFYIHPNFAAQVGDFEDNDVFTVMTYPYDYKKAISEGVLLVSDYSSVVLDFAYLHKPVVYTQFDADEFFASHSYNKGDFFHDETDGFGPIAHDYKQAIEKIEEYIKHDCKNTTEYIKRAKNFFKYDDKYNSERAYRAIVNGR